MAISIIQLNSRAEWLEHRKNYIGGSDASCIVGMNPYKSNVELWEEKTGKKQADDISDKPYVRYGTEAEEHLRALFALDFPQYKVSYDENNMWLNDRYPFAHASLDAWLEDEDGRKGILEIKTTNILQSMQREKWNHRIPDNYYIQVLHYLMVTEFDFAILRASMRFQYGNDVTFTIKQYSIERSDVHVLEDIKYLQNAERHFYECIKNNVKPNLILPEI